MSDKKEWRENITAIKEMLEMHPSGTHFCALEQKSRFAEFLTRFISEYEDEKQRADKAYAAWRTAINRQSTLEDQLRNAKRDLKKDKEKPDFLSIIEDCGTIHDQVAQLEKWYEKEKQRADILENYNEVNSGLAKARKKVIYDLEKENQKLKEALESTITALEQTSNLTSTQVYQFVSDKKELLK